MTTSLMKRINECNISVFGQNWKNSLLGDITTDKIKEEELTKKLDMLFKKIGEVVISKYLDSETRGVLRGFVPIRKVDNYLTKKSKEVPLVRSLALIKNWNCEMPLLSGINESSSEGKKVAIDLVISDKKKNKGTLIEVKDWNGKDKLISAIIQIIQYMFCFLYVRNIDKDKNIWPKWDSIELVVLAPHDYFYHNIANKDLNKNVITRLVSAINNALTSNLPQYSKYGLKNVIFKIREIQLSEAEFTTFLKKNRSIIGREIQDAKKLKAISI